MTVERRLLAHSPFYSNGGDPQRIVMKGEYNEDGQLVKVVIHNHFVTVDGNDVYDTGDYFEVAAFQEASNVVWNAWKRFVERGNGLAFEYPLFDATDPRFKD
jgi:hypothetical protein